MLFPGIVLFVIYKFNTFSKQRVGDGVHGMRQELLTPTEKIGGILWKNYVPRGTKKLGNRCCFFIVGILHLEIFIRLTKTVLWQQAKETIIVLSLWSFWFAESN